MDFESATKTIRPYYSLSCSISATHTFVDGGEKFWLLRFASYIFGFLLSSHDMLELRVCLKAHFWAVSSKHTELQHQFLSISASLPLCLSRLSLCLSLSFSLSHTHTHTLCFPCGVSYLCAHLLPKFRLLPRHWPCDHGSSRPVSREARHRRVQDPAHKNRPVFLRYWGFHGVFWR